jgi:hypothetical protein
MARRQDKQRAIELRKTGKSYREIRSVLNVSKGTLSGWLNNFPLSPAQLTASKHKRVETYIATRKRNREVLLKNIYEEQKLKILPLSKRDIFIAGIFLYLGEGGKTTLSELALSNTDPAIVKSFIVWLKSMGVDVSRTYFRLHLYKDMNPEKEIMYWCDQLGVARSQFRNSYIKKSNLIDITYKNGYGHGTCNARFGNAILTRKIFMAMKVVKDFMMRA